MPDDLVEHVLLPPFSLGGVRQLVASRLGMSLSRPTLSRVTAASGGNPLFALEICRALEVAKREPGPTEALPLPSTLQRLVSSRVEALSASAQEAILVAASLSRPTPIAVTRAMRTSGEAGLAEARSADILMSENGRIRFVHPLFASAVYAAASLTTRRALHRRLARGMTDPDERARHLAAGVEVPDARVAAEIEEAARRAARRGAQDTAAALFAASCRLTPPALGDLRARRTLGQAAASNATGSFATARRLAANALDETFDPVIRAAALSLLGDIEWYDGKAEIAAGLVERAVAEAGSDRELLGPLHGQLVRLNFSWDLRAALDHAAKARELLDEEPAPATLATVLVDQLFGSGLRGRRVAKAQVDRALDLESRSIAQMSAPHPMVLLWLHCTDQHAAARDRCSLEKRWYGERGEEVWLADRLSHLAVAEVHAGDLDSAERHAEWSCASVEHLVVGGPRAMVFEKRSLVDAYRGRLDRGRSTLQKLLAEYERAGQDWWAALTLSTLAFVESVAGDHRTADALLTQMHEKADSIGVVDVLFDRSEPSHVESLLAVGQIDSATAALKRLEDRGRRLPRPWITAALPHCREHAP